MDNMTPAGQYLSGEAQGTLANAENAINQALSNIGEQNLPLGALSEPAWREVSTNLVTEAESISKVFPSEMPNPNSVFMQNELTTALELHPEIAGIPAEQLRNLPPNELANLFNSGATPVEPLSSERPSLANILAAGGLGVAGILGSIINAAFVGEAKAPERPYDPPQVGTGDPASRPDPLQQPDPNQFHAPQTYTNYYGGSYATQAEADHAQDDHQDAADNTGDNGPKGEPIILDLTGNGIKITQKSQSGMFFDMAGDGYQHHTAWAGAGNGVLVLDIGNTGKITQQNQVVFTKWDPTATNDMQALRDVFDTNHNGKLDAGDAHYNDFKILVTNADGTTSLQTLAQAA